jgi:hypothetical protein
MNQVEILKGLGSQSKQIKHVRTIIEHIGVCKSVKGVSQASYETVYDILTNHPEADKKLHDAVDFYIRINVRSGTGLEVMIRKSDGTETDVSWNTAAKGKGRTPRESFCRALRVSIEDQIKAFRRRPTTDTSVCAICSNPVEAYHVDHVITFKRLVDDFIATYTDFVYPQNHEYEECNDGTNQYRLTDKVLESAFQSHHLEKATLRITCARCNLTRPM